MKESKLYILHHNAFMSELMDTDPWSIGQLNFKLVSPYGLNRWTNA